MAESESDIDIDWWTDSRLRQANKHMDRHQTDNGVTVHLPT